MLKEKMFRWSSQQEDKNCELIPCAQYDTYKDFKLDPSGHYVLIRVNFEYLRIDVAICSKDNYILKVFSGSKAQDVYHAIFQYEKQNKLEWFLDKEHIAYLGKELKKAEIALSLGNNAYFQE